MVTSLFRPHFLSLRNALTFSHNKILFMRSPRKYHQRQNSEIPIYKILCNFTPFRPPLEANAVLKTNIIQHQFIQGVYNMLCYWPLSYELIPQKVTTICVQPWSVKIFFAKIYFSNSSMQWKREKLTSFEGLGVTLAQYFRKILDHW